MSSSSTSPAMPESADANLTTAENMAVELGIEVLPLACPFAGNRLLATLAIGFPKISQLQIY